MHCLGRVYVDRGEDARGVPAPDGQVDAAAEGHRVVDDHDLLMVHRTGWVNPVDCEIHSRRGDLIEKTYRGNSVPEPVEDGQEAKVGLQQVYVQLATPPQEPVRKGPR